ncbi:MAG: alanine-tRNA synthetase second additional domain-containing protein [Eubacteriaceae bacterium]
MSYSQKMQKNNLYSIYFAPRGQSRMVELGMQIAQQYMSPFDNIIGIIGDAGSGKSMLIKGMLPGLDLTNDDGGMKIRPLPLLGVKEPSFSSPHTYHVDIRFEAAFTPLFELADAILEVAKQKKRVVVEHFEMIYPLLKRNADLLIGVGEEIIITRPTIFGPEPKNIADIVYGSIQYRRMAHSAEDLCVHCMGLDAKEERSDVQHGFVLQFDEKPDFSIEELEEKVKKMIEENVPISLVDEGHIAIGDYTMPCQGPRIHVKSTGEIEGFSLVKQFVYDETAGCYMLIGQVGNKNKEVIKNLNKIKIAE